MTYPFELQEIFLDAECDGWTVKITNITNNNRMQKLQDNVTDTLQMGLLDAVIVACRPPFSNMAFVDVFGGWPFRLSATSIVPTAATREVAVTSRFPIERADE
ncbi:hypothetical protein [Roseibium sp. SCP14]|uniref:hypothetical protein n=1 Tax=Roseibium sp. SCP14 TaxID=3141375 RepID=UPI00333937C5